MVSAARCFHRPLVNVVTICVGPILDCASVLDIKKPESPSYGL
jgi:hypothetical protein